MRITSGNIAVMLFQSLRTTKKRPSAVGLAVGADMIKAAFTFTLAATVFTFSTACKADALPDGTTEHTYFESPQWTTRLVLAEDPQSVWNTSYCEIRSNVWPKRYIAFQRVHYDGQAATVLAIHNDSWSFTEEDQKNPVKVGVATGPQYRSSGRVVPMNSLDAQTVFIAAFDLSDVMVAGKYSKVEQEALAQALTFVFLLQQYAINANTDPAFRPQSLGVWFPAGNEPDWVVPGVSPFDAYNLLKSYNDCQTEVLKYLPDAKQSDPQTPTSPFGK